MTEVIQPAAGQTVITTDHHGYHHRHHNDHRFDTIEARADFRALTNEIERVGAVTGDRVHAVGAATQTGFTGLHDRVCDATGKIVHEIDRHGDAAALAACKTNDAIADSKLFAAVQFKDQIIAQDKNAAAQSVLTTTVGNAAQVLATSFANAASVQATSNHNSLNVQIERVRAEIDAKVSAGFAAAQLLAFQHKADSDAKAAECCCDLKALILAESSKGRELANEIEARRVQNELQRLQTQVAILTGGVVGARASQGL